MRRTRTNPNSGSTRAGIHESGIVPSGTRKVLPTALTLHAPRADVVGFGSALAGGADILLAGGRLAERHPFGALYRLTPEGAVRERVLHGATAHLGPVLASDGTRIVVGQPSADGGAGFVSVYRDDGHTLELETTLEGERGTRTGERFGECVAVGGDLLVLGQPASVSVYRHSPVGWLSAGTLRPELPYAWNPSLGRSLGVVAGRILVGNPVEISGYRAGPGRVFVYRQGGDQIELECVLLGDGIEFGREDQPRRGFGASLHVAGNHVLIGAPHEQLPDGRVKSRVHVFRLEGASFTRVASLTVPSCDGGACMIGERVFVLGDALHVFERDGQSYLPCARYPLDEPSSATLAACRTLLAIGRPQRGAGEVTLHFADLL